MCKDDGSASAVIRIIGYSIVLLENLPMYLVNAYNNHKLILRGSPIIPYSDLEEGHCDNKGKIVQWFPLGLPCMVDISGEHCKYVQYAAVSKI